MQLQCSVMLMCALMCSIKIINFVIIMKEYSLLFISHFCTTASIISHSLIIMYFLNTHVHTFVLFIIIIKIMINAYKKSCARMRDSSLMLRCSWPPPHSFSQIRIRLLTHSLCPFLACASSLSRFLTFEDIMFSNTVADAGAQALTKIVAFIVAHVYFCSWFCVDAGLA